MLYTLVSLPLVWGYIVVNLACGYLYGVTYGMAVTVITATVGIALAHILCKVMWLVDFVLILTNIPLSKA